MTGSFLLSPKAEIEILKAWEWYEEKRTGLGDQFKDEVREQIKLVVKNPLHYQLKGKYRQAKTAIFPFLIVYRFDRKTSVVLIVSVFHTSRHPKRK
jgi:plasmid stabilization system protein ParE